MLGTLLPSIQKGLNECCKLLLFTAAAAREAGKAELSASLGEGNEWVPRRSPSQAGCRQQSQGNPDGEDSPNHTLSYADGFFGH